MKINESVRTALERAIEYHGNVYQLAKAMGISHSTILFWLNGKTGNINGSLWVRKIRDFLEPFMDKTDLKEIPFPEYHVDKALPAKVEPNHRTTVLSLFQLQNWEPVLRSVEKLKNASDGEEVVFSLAVEPRDFCFLVNSEYAGYFPEGTRLLVSTTRYPENEDVVLGKLRDNDELFLGRYWQEGDIITIVPLNPVKKKIVVDCKKNHGYFVWIFPVMEASMYLHKEHAKEPVSQD